MGFCLLLTCSPLHRLLMTCLPFTFSTLPCLPCLPALPVLDEPDKVQVDPVVHLDSDLPATACVAWTLPCLVWTLPSS